MLKEIQLLLSSFSKQPADYKIDINSWQQIIALYRLSDKSAQDILITGLTKRFSLENNGLVLILESLKADDVLQPFIDLALTSLHTMQESAEDQKIDTFKKRALRIVPRLSILEPNRHEWLELIRRYEKLELTRLSKSFILFNLSTIRKLDYETLSTSFDRKPLLRATKPSFTNTNPAPAKRKCHHYDKIDGGENPLILESTEENTYLDSPLRKTGVRITKLSQTSPEHGYNNVKRTPGNSKVHHVYSNRLGSFFKPVTPYGSKAKKGMVDTRNATHSDIERRIPRRLFERAEAISFTATLEKLQERQGIKRKIGQKLLTGASCREVFTAQGSESTIEINGREYHWSHLIAHYLGGEQNKENLIPGTAVSNYNTLELVEQFIARQLTEEKIDSIDILVKPSYSGESFIPDELVFHLSWLVTGEKHLHYEEISINPRSYQRITGSEHKAIEVLREMDTNEKTLHVTPS